MPTEGGRLILVGAPLGNVGDASPRLRDTLSTADVVAAEDTRRLTRLARDLGIEVAGRVVSYFEGNEQRRTPELARALRDGLVVAVVTDGGMPSVSDPGFRLVRAAIDAGVPVTVAPGPSAVTTALAVSGLASDRFCFEGFLPRKPSERRARLVRLGGEERTMVFFEAPHRVAASLTDFVEAFGRDRSAAVCRELTKTYEEVRRGGLGELADWAAHGEPRGEITIVVAGVDPITERPTDEALLAAVSDRQAAGASRKDAVAQVAAAYAIGRRELYNLVVGSAR
jgi:16S rRNA (cytidine1402-2'-O)-methyltransferase